MGGRLYQRVQRSHKLRLLVCDRFTSSPGPSDPIRWEANEIQRGLASWYLPAQTPPACLQGPPR